MDEAMEDDPEDEDEDDEEELDEMDDQEHLADLVGPVLLLQKPISDISIIKSQSIANEDHAILQNFMRNPRDTHPPPSTNDILKRLASTPDPNKSSGRPLKGGCCCLTGRLRDILHPYVHSSLASIDLGPKSYRGLHEVSLVFVYLRPPCSDIITQHYQNWPAIIAIQVRTLAQSFQNTAIALELAGATGIHRTGRMDAACRLSCYADICLQP